MRPHSKTIRSHFPQLQGANRTIYFDNAATTLKPKQVIDTISSHLSSSVSNVHRGSCSVSESVSEKFEAARQLTASSLGASQNELFFTHNSTYGLNMIAEMLRQNGAKNCFVTGYEHHSHLAPWTSRFRVKKLPCDDSGTIDSDKLPPFRKGDIVCVAHVSNVTAIIQPLDRIAKWCRQRGATLVVDGAQGFPHLPVHVGNMGCDFYVFSAHKTLGPSGVGVVFGRGEVLRQLTPVWLGGGTFEKFSLSGHHAFTAVPHRFECGTPNIEGVLATATAIRFLDKVGKDKIAAESIKMGNFFRERIRNISGKLQIVGDKTESERLSIVTLNIAGIASDKLAILLADRYGICSRAGYHCTHPLYQALGISGGIRFSPYIYNTYDECNAVLEALEGLIKNTTPKRNLSFVGIKNPRKSIKKHEQLVLKTRLRLQWSSGDKHEK